MSEDGHRKVCKRAVCMRPFEQPRIQGRPVEYCSAECKITTRAENNARHATERYRALRFAGVESKLAQWSSLSRGRFERTLFAHRSNDGSLAAE